MIYHSLDYKLIVNFKKEKISCLINTGDFLKGKREYLFSDDIYRVLKPYHANFIKEDIRLKDSPFFIYYPIEYSGLTGKDLKSGLFILNKGPIDKCDRVCSCFFENGAFREQTWSTLYLEEDGHVFRKRHKTYKVKDAIINEDPRLCIPVFTPLDFTKEK